MATYLELATLQGNPDFLARIAYAVGSFAAYVFNEAPEVPNHAARYNWALKAMLDPRATAATLVPEVCRDADVVYGQAAIPDASLQVAVEVAAGKQIPTVAAYADLMTLALDPAFLRRLQIALAEYAMYILNEDPATPDHKARYAWAKNAIVSTAFIAGTLAPAIVVDQDVSQKLMGISDAALQLVVEVKAKLLV